MRELESRAFVLLRRAQGAPPLVEDEAAALQAQHLAYLEELAAAGKLVGAGPFSDQPDESLRGLCVMATTLEEAFFNATGRSLEDEEAGDDDEEEDA